MFLLCIQVHRARSGRSEPRQDKDTNIFLLLFISQFGGGFFSSKLFSCGPGRWYYSAPGFLSHGDGLLYQTGNYGYDWSSSVNSIGGRNLNFYTSNINPTYVGGRAYGFPLRCLSE